MRTSVVKLLLLLFLTTLLLNLALDPSTISLSDDPTTQSLTPTTAGNTPDHTHQIVASAATLNPPLSVGLRRPFLKMFPALHLATSAHSIFAPLSFTTNHHLAFTRPPARAVITPLLI